MKLNNRKIGSYLLLITLVVLGIVVLETDFIEKIYDKFEDYRLSKIEQIKIEDNSLKGNNQSNINNYGIVAETKDSFYYTLDTTIYKSDKKFKGTEDLFIRPGKDSKDTINILDNWIFYRQFDEIKRMKMDGSSVNTVFKGYSFDMRIFGNWIYFLGAPEYNLYKMDLNGRNREVLVNRDVRDMTIYDGKIYYCYEEDEKYYLKKINQDGSGEVLLLKTEARDLVADSDYIYYIDEDYKLCRLTLKDNSIEKLSNEEIFSFVKDDKWIFYTLKGEEDKLGNKGLYRMDLDGNNVLELDGDARLDEIGLGITDDWIFYHSINEEWRTLLNRIGKDGKNASIIENNEVENKYEEKLN